MLSITIDDLMSWNPCAEYPKARVNELFAGAERVTTLDILDWDIPAKDRLWGVLHEELIPAPLLHELACQFAEHALVREREVGREPDTRSWAAIEAKRAWLRGEITDTELATACYAAWAAKVADRDAARAARDASADWDAECEYQIALIRKLVSIENEVD
jgi:hypothetical protein